MEPLILAETLCDFPLEFAQTFKFGEIVQLDILGSKWQNRLISAPGIKIEKLDQSFFL